MLGSELAKQAWLELGTESIVVVPLFARGRMTGVLTLCRGAERSPMSDEEIVIAGEVATRAGLALDNARLYAEQRSLAEGLQRSLLTTPPEPEDCEIVARYVPAAEVASVGGDWFDSFLQPDGATVLVIGDVMGHDTVAAAAMGHVRGLLRGIAWHTGAAPAAVLSGLDAAMQGLQVGTTATAVVARLEPEPEEPERGFARLRWSNAGHPPPLAVDVDGTVTVLTGESTDLLLGIDPGTIRTETTRTFRRGATLLLYTDGLIERRDQDLDTGLTLLSETLAELADLPLERLCDQLLARMLPVEAEDDIALIAIRLHPQD
jgi:serine phosphatase RsbU (regulator of sigma subunit)